MIIGICGAAAVGAWALKENDPEAHAAGGSTAENKFGKEGTLVAPVATPTTPLRTLDHAHPLNVWVGGDSLAGLLGPALGDRVGATGVVTTLIDYKTSSGLWSNDIRNWKQRATDQMALVHPEAVVFIIGANDTPVVNEVDANGDNVPDWEADYRPKVARMMDILVGPEHRTVFWLGPPTLGTQSMDRGAKEIGQVMREEALKRSPDVVYLDTYKLFSTSDGSYSRSIVDENGKEILARLSDGVHFTSAGADYLARAVFVLVNARWHLTKQADSGHPIGWNFAPGSGEVVPGYSSTPRSKYRQNRNVYNPKTAPFVSATTLFVTPSTFAAPPPSSTPPVTVPPTAPPTTASHVTVPPTTPTPTTGP